MHIEECQAIELRRHRITANRPDSADGCKRHRVYVQPSPGPEPELCILSKKATYSGRAYKTEIFKSCIGQNIIQLSIKWTIYIVMKYHSKLFIIWISLFLKLV